MKSALHRAQLLLSPFYWGWARQSRPGIYLPTTAKRGAFFRDPRLSHPETVEVCGRKTPACLEADTSWSSHHPAPRCQLLSWPLAQPWDSHPSLLAPTPSPSNRKALLLCLLIKGSFYPTPAFCLVRLFNCMDSNKPSLSGQPLSGNGCPPRPLPRKRSEGLFLLSPQQGTPPRSD